MRVLLDRRNGKLFSILYETTNTLPGNFHGSFTTQPVKTTICSRRYRTTARLKKSSSNKSNGTSCTVIAKKGKVIYRIQQALRPGTMKAAENPHSILPTGKANNVQISKPKPFADQTHLKSSSNLLHCKETPGKTAETLPISKCKEKMIGDVQKTVADKLSFPHFVDTSVPNSRMDVLGNTKMKKCRVVEVRKVIRETIKPLNSTSVKGPRQSKLKSILAGTKSLPELISNDLYNFSVKSGGVHSSKASGAFVELRPKRIRFSSKEMVYPNIGELGVSKMKKGSSAKNTKTEPDSMKPVKLDKCEENENAGMKAADGNGPKNRLEIKQEATSAIVVSPREVSTGSNTTPMEDVKSGELSSDSGCGGSPNNSNPVHGEFKPKKEVQSFQYNDNFTIHKHPVNRTKKAPSENYETVVLIEKDGKTITKIKPKKSKRGLSPKRRVAVFTEGSISEFGEDQDGLQHSKGGVISGSSKQFATGNYFCDNKLLNMDSKASNYTRKKVGEVPLEASVINIANDKKQPSRSERSSFDEIVKNMTFESDLFLKELHFSVAQQAQSLRPIINHTPSETDSTKNSSSGDANISKWNVRVKNSVVSDATTEGPIRHSEDPSNLNSLSPNKDYGKYSGFWAFPNMPSMREEMSTVTVARKPSTDTNTYASLNQTPQSSTGLTSISTDEANEMKWSEEYGATMIPRKFTASSNIINEESENEQGRVIKQAIPCKTGVIRGHNGYSNNVSGASCGISAADIVRVLVEKNKHLNTSPAEKQNNVGEKSAEVTETESAAARGQPIGTPLSQSEFTFSSFQKQGEMFSTPTLSDPLRSETREVNKLVGNDGDAFDFNHYKSIFQSSNLTTSPAGASAENCVPSCKPPFPQMHSCSSSIDCIPKCKPVFPPPCKSCTARDAGASVDNCASPCKPPSPPIHSCSSNIDCIPKCKPVFPPPCKSYSPRDAGASVDVPAWKPPSPPIHSCSSSIDPKRKPVFPQPCKSYNPRDPGASVEYNRVPACKPPSPPIHSCSTSIDCIPTCKPAFPPLCTSCNPRDPGKAIVEDDKYLSRHVSSQKPVSTSAPSGASVEFNCLPVCEPPIPPIKSCASSNDCIRTCKPAFPPLCTSCNPRDPRTANMEDNRCDIHICPQKPVFNSAPSATCSPPPPCCPPSSCCPPPPPCHLPCAPSNKSKTYSILDVSDLPKPPIPIRIDCTPKEKPCFPPKCASEPQTPSASFAEETPTFTQPMSQTSCSCKKIPSFEKCAAFHTIPVSVSWLDASKIFIRDKVYLMKSLLTDLITKIFAILKRQAILSQLWTPSPVCSENLVQSSFVAHNQPLAATASKLSGDVKRGAGKEKTRLSPSSKRIIRIRRVKRTVHDEQCRRAIFLEEEKRKATGSKANPSLAYSEVLNIVFSQRNDAVITKKQRRGSVMN